MSTLRSLFAILALATLGCGAARADIPPPPGTPIPAWQIGCRRVIPLQSVETVRIEHHGSDTVLVADGIGTAQFGAYRLVKNEPSRTPLPSGEQVKPTGPSFTFYGCFSGAPPMPTGPVPAHAEVTLAPDEAAARHITVTAKTNEKTIDLDASH